MLPHASPTAPRAQHAGGCRRDNITPTHTYIHCITQHAPPNTRYRQMAGAQSPIRSVPLVFVILLCCPHIHNPIHVLGVPFTYDDVVSRWLRQRSSFVLSGCLHTERGHAHARRICGESYTYVRLLQGDFVVFHIGARPNNKLDKMFKGMGEAFREMGAELEDHPELGCLGSEAFIGPTGTSSVQCWRSLDHLNAYTRSRTNLHASARTKVRGVLSARVRTTYGTCTYLLVRHTPTCPVDVCTYVRTYVCM